MEQIILILSISLLISLSITMRLFIINDKLKKENRDLKLNSEKVSKYTEELLSIEVGDRAIIPDYGLTYTSKNIDFSVTYEVEIVDISIDKVKVKAIDFEANDSAGIDPKNKNGIIAFMQDKWIDKKRIQLLVDDSMRRDKKLRELGILD